MGWFVAFLLVLPFSLVLLYGAPYLPTKRKTAETALDMLELRAGQHLVDLGSGDGAVLIAAARRKIYSTGYELNPIIWFVSYVRCLPYRRYITIRLGNFWSISIPKGTNAVFVFLLDKYMKRLDEKLIKELKKGSKVASYTFEIPGRKVISEKNAVYLYVY